MSEESARGPGERLKAAREGMEVSAREVADALNLPIRVIEALESDDYDRLPPTVFTRGYLRSYARLLELPGDELLALYPEVEAEADTGTMEVTPPVGSDQRQMKLAMGAGGILIVLIGLLLWIFGGDAADETAPVQPPSPDVVSQEPAVEDPNQPREPEGESDVAAQPVLEGEPAPRLEPPDRDVAGSEPEIAAEPVVPAAVIEPVPETVSDAVAAEEESLPFEARPMASATEPGARRITPSGDDLIRFTFSDECWVEVKDLDGENLYSDLNRAGQTLILQGRGPFRILVGYAPGVELEFNGEPVALSRYTRNNVATLVLGE